MHLSTVNTFKHMDNSNSDRVITLDQAAIHRIQQVLLGIAEDIIDVCTEEHICYHLTGGSALGAVRHQGFIPWDDDLDIDIPGSDFDRFVQAFTGKYGDKYWVETYQTPGYGILVNRVRLRDSIYRTREDDQAEECGFFVDIIRIENTFDFPLARFLHGVFCMGFGFLLSCRNFYQHRVLMMDLLSDPENVRTCKLKIDIGRLLSFLPLETWARITQRCYGLCKNNHSKYVTVPAGRKHYFGELRLRKDFVETVDATFEGHNWKIPKDYDGYLKSMYGDYREIPEEADREKHVVLELKFPDEETNREDKGSSKGKENKIEYPAISVIMPVYNTASYLKGSISSVLRQTFSSFELILINDGSDDDSQKICEKACKKDQRVRLLNCPEHKGVSHARNLGLEAAKGKYICFQDSDDLMHPQLLECMWQETEKAKADVAMVDHWNSNILTRKKWHQLCERSADSNWEIWEGEKAWESFCYSKLGGIVWAKLFLRESIGDLRFCEELNQSEDWLFNYQFMNRKPQLIAVTNFKGCYHLIKPNSLTHRSTIDEFLVGMKVKRFVRDQELKAGREENALCIEREIIANIRGDWIYMNPKEAAADRDKLLKVLHDLMGKSPLFEKLSLYQKSLLFLSIYAMPVFRGLKTGKDQTLCFLNSFLRKT